MAVREEKSFSKEDLSLVKDDNSVDTEDSSEDKGTPEGDVSQDNSVNTGKEPEKNSEEERAKPKVRTSILDDDDDDPEPDKKTEGKETQERSEPDKKDEKKEEVKVDWRDSLVDLALKGKENELTAAKLAKRREALKNRLGRYRSEQDYMLAGLAAQEKLASGEYRRAKLPDDATEEEKATWRKETGLPEKAQVDRGRWSIHRFFQGGRLLIEHGPRPDE